MHTQHDCALVVRADPPGTFKMIPVVLFRGLLYSHRDLFHLFTVRVGNFEIPSSSPPD